MDMSHSSPPTPTPPPSITFTPIPFPIVSGQRLCCLEETKSSSASLFVTHTHALIVFNGQNLHPYSEAIPRELPRLLAGLSGMACYWGSLLLIGWLIDLGVFYPLLVSVCWITMQNQTLWELLTHQPYASFAHSSESTCKHTHTAMPHLV
ncbi:hypothetical protein CHARACLAT_000365 [Characodon lateralis]|uniref:Uncharacterized protein n=1 Tax=Characodon lateralis TaxID=208331 RepID=A0ABU7CU87_9TELE|nr:hypothetical protein [Characodon lateralis]